MTQWLCLCVCLFLEDVWWGQSHQRVLTFSLIGPQAECGVTALLYIDLANNTLCVSFLIYSQVNYAKTHLLCWLTFHKMCICKA